MLGSSAVDFASVGEELTGADVWGGRAETSTQTRHYARKVSIAQAGWNAVDWGTVPDWLAAVGTVGAFAATLVILALDRRRSRRAPAAGLVLWTTRRFRSTPHGDTQSVTVHAFNTSAGPIPTANVVSKAAGNDYVNEVLSADERGFKEIAPGSKTEVEIDVVHFVDDSALYVFFVDFQGGQWVKRISDGRLFTPRRGRKLAGLDR